MSAGALRVSALSKSYGELHALVDVSFELHEGEVTAVLGPNGAGKTTLLSILAGAQHASAGSVSRPAREIGWAPQQPALYSRLSVAENLRLFARLERVPDPTAAVARMLEQTGLGERAEDPVGTLSGGNRQRVNVALGLIADPPVLALDEPSAALDPRQRERLWEFLHALADAGRAIVCSSHDVGEAQRHADRLLVLARGRLLFDGAPDALRREVGAEDTDGDLERALIALLEARDEPVGRAAA